jgi:hypothetical protein
MTLRTIVAAICSVLACQLAQAHDPAVLVLKVGDASNIPPLRQFLQLANLSHVGTEEVDCGKKAYPFVRNLAAFGGNGTVVLNTPFAFAFHNDQFMSTVALYRYFENAGYDITVLRPASWGPVNFANVAYVANASLLVAAFGDKGVPCDNRDRPAFSSRCDADKWNGVQKAFGSPRHVVPLEADYTMLAPYKGEWFGRCDDMDMYLNLFENGAGRRIAMVYPDCIMKEPHDPAAWPRGKVFAKLRHMGYTTVKVSEEDFHRGAPNAISPVPGTVIFGGRVSDLLRYTLGNLSMNVVQPPENVVPFNEPGAPAGLHCVTLELPPLPPSAAPPPVHDEL